MRYFDKLPQGIAKPCEDLINYIEDPDVAIQISDFEYFSDLGVNSDLVRSFDLDYLGSSYRIELQYVERHNGDSLYVRNNDRRLIQYVFNKFVFEKDGRVVFKHDGKLFGVKNWSSKDVLDEAKKLDSSLKISDNEIVLTSFPIDDFSDEVKDTLLVNLIKYAIIRSNKRYQIVNNSPEIKNTHQIKNMYSSFINLLKYKKQIILQGPPGTGKTREAKMIAEELIGNNSKVSDLKQYFKVGQKINSTSGIASYYDVLEVHANKITIKNEKAVENREISLETINDTISQINTGQVDKTRVNYAYESALATYLMKEVKSSDQIKLIQFHPSYTYEDFVRGIVSKPSEDGDGIVYEAENKLLADFANEAVKANDIFTKIEMFVDIVSKVLKQNEENRYYFDEDSYISAINNNFLIFNNNYWSSSAGGTKIDLEDLNFLLKNNVKDLSEIYKLPNRNTTHKWAKYIIKIISDIIIKTHKDYVLIIDEVNRANLSAVLGELIYALEYRGEAVESMYAVGNDNKLILPPNLYIIGTMNTADRSVGHIDYAIRRRFAFVDVLPKDLSEEDNISFDTELFYSVEKLFDTNLSPEFEKKDVQLGHSYFIDKSEEGGSIDIRLEYEIKPILFEYVKDGVLIGDDIKKLIDDLEPSI